VSKRTDAIRAAAAADYGEEGEVLITMASHVALAWVEQICADADAWAAKADEKQQQIVRAAKKMAGEYQNDIVASCPGMVPMIHKLDFSNREVVAVGTMLAGCVPLWNHYYAFIRDTQETIDNYMKET